MQKVLSYYDILGVQENASMEDIKKSYREKSKLFHPDKYVNNPLYSLALEKQKQLNEAYEVLSNSDKRNSYDQERKGQQQIMPRALEEYIIAQGFFDNGQFQEALICLQKSLILEPDFWQALEGAGYIYIQLGQYNKALEISEILIGKKLVNGYILKAVTIFNDDGIKDKNTGYILLLEALQLEPNNEIVRKLRDDYLITVNLIEAEEIKKHEGLVKVVNYISCMIDGGKKHKLLDEYLIRLYVEMNDFTLAEKYLNQLNDSTTITKNELVELQKIFIGKTFLANTKRLVSVMNASSMPAPLFGCFVVPGVVVLAVVVFIVTMFYIPSLSIFPALSVVIGGLILAYKGLLGSLPLRDKRLSKNYCRLMGKNITADINPCQGSYFIGAMVEQTPRIINVENTMVFQSKYADTSKYCSRCIFNDDVRTKVVDWRSVSDEMSKAKGAFKDYFINDMPIYGITTQYQKSIYEMLNKKSTQELETILKERNQRLYENITFEVAKLILDERNALGHRSTGFNCRYCKAPVLNTFTSCPNCGATNMFIRGDVDDVSVRLPISMGLETSGGKMTKLIVRNTPLPVNINKTFSTTVDNQPNIYLHIMQGESEKAAECCTICRVNLLVLPPAPRGTPQIDVKFFIPTPGVLKLLAKDKNTGENIEMIIKMYLNGTLGRILSVEPYM